MTASDWFLLALRLGHALAATIWLGGGVYYLLALRPAVIAATAEADAQALASRAQRAFGEWASVASLVMVATGVVLTFDRLSNGDDGLRYAALLALKIAAAIGAFWFAGFRPARRAVRQRGAKRSAPELIVGLGLLAFVLGVILSSIYGRGMA